MAIIDHQRQLTAVVRCTFAKTFSIFIQMLAVVRRFAQKRLNHFSLKAFKREGFQKKKFDQLQAFDVRWRSHCSAVSVRPH